jgi:hypothetical protein
MALPPAATDPGVPPLLRASALALEQLEALAAGAALMQPPMRS